MRIGLEHIGKEVKRFDIPVRVNYVGNGDDFMGTCRGSEHPFPKESAWELVEEKKKKWAPALVNSSASGFWFVSSAFYSSEERAKESWQKWGDNPTVIWPAPLPDKDGFYDIPEGGKDDN